MGIRAAKSNHGGRRWKKVREARKEDGRRRISETNQQNSQAEQTLLHKGEINFLAVEDVGSLCVEEICLHCV